MILENIISYIEKRGDDKIRKRIEELEGVQYRNLVKQIESVNWEKFFDIREQVSSEREKRLDFKTKAEISLLNRWENVSYIKDFEEIGIEALKSGEVAVLIPSWHQDDIGIIPYPGQISIQPISGKSLINLHLDRMLGTYSTYQALFPIIIVTDKYRDKKVKIYLQQNDYFGNEVSNFRFISQNWYPAFDEMGKLRFYTKNTLAGGCDGELGAIRALKHSNLLRELKSQGVKYISMNSLMNVLAFNPDPVFLGGHIKFESEVSYKVTSDPNNPEFTGSIIFNIDWLSDKAEELEKNLKRVIYEVPVLIDNETHRDEQLYFLKYDWIGFLNTIENSVCFYVDKEEEYFELNPEKPNTLKEAKGKLLNRIYRWLNMAGIKFKVGSEIELNPLFALTPHQLKEKLPSEIKLQGTIILEACEEYEKEVLEKLKFNNMN